jgi:hypothetical protein
MVLSKATNRWYGEGGTGSVDIPSAITPLPRKPPGDPKPWRGGRIAGYHITHVANLDSIVDCGEIRCDSECALMEAAPTSIAYANLKERRASPRVTVGPGGTLADYVPFYYAPRSPMLYVNYRGGVTGNATGQNEIVHLVVDVDELADGGNFVITDGHAATPLTTQFDATACLEEIDWPIMEEQYWSDTDEDGDRKRRR